MKMITNLEHTPPHEGGIQQVVYETIYEKYEQSLQ